MLSGPSPRRRRAGLSLVAVAALLLGCGAARRGGGGAVAAPPVARLVSSNVQRSDYAGSEACARCHADLYESWRRSPMHNMTRTADPLATPPHDRAGAAPTAPRLQFDGRRFDFMGDAVQLEERDGRRFMRLQSQRFGDHLYRVTRLVGGHHREDFVGLEVDGEGQDGRARAGAVERVLPVSHLLDGDSLRYKGYSVMVRERPGIKVGGVWSQTCLFCHNTVPYLSVLWGTLAGPGAPAYQGELVDAHLPPGRRVTFGVRDVAGFGRAVAQELDRLGAPLRAGPPAGLAAQAARATRQRFGAAELLEEGIGCESCHGGCREHVEDFRRAPSFAPQSPLLTVTPPAGLDAAAWRAQAQTRACARCHQVLFSRYPYTWEGGLRAEAGAGRAGGSNINSGEARDFLLGGCATAMTCTACHDPHAADDRQRRATLDAPAAANAVCTACHSAYAGAAALQAHSHHPAGDGSPTCFGCHMPRKNMSLDLRLTRYHRIGSPTDEARVLRDRPLECALCHAERPIGELVGLMERWWGKRYDRAVLARLYGDLGRSAIIATLERGLPHEQATALGVLRGAPDRAALPLVVAQLENSIPLVRFYALAALDAIAGRAAALDGNLAGPELAAAARRWLAAAGMAVERRPAPGAAGEPAAAGADED